MIKFNIMEGLIIWAHSYCRSTLGFFRGLGVAFDVPLKLCIWKMNAKLRTKVGFKEDEFSDMDITFVGDDYLLAHSILEEYKHYHHIFGAYQSVPIYQRLILDAKSFGCHVGIASEAPCNMTAGVKRYLKHIYVRYVLPHKVKNQIDAADFIINLSGDDSKPLESIGWQQSEIIPCGYYSPRIENTRVVERNSDNWKNFTILLTGLHQWHRSPVLLIKALEVLKGQGLVPKCYITQEGPLLDKMKKMVKESSLDVEFLGFVEMSELIKLYETCSVYVGTGNYEPWGMRLNDVLQCGAPLIVNKGMGGYKLVQDFGCGLIFEKNDYRGLADAISKLMTDEQLYLTCAEKAIQSVMHISPESKAKEIAAVIKENYKGW